MRYIQPFKKISMSDSRNFGGKVASLGEMTQFHIPVPVGFGISIEAHREFRDKPFSKDFKKELSVCFSKLNGKRVAVRSSAVAEDSSDASWAGQLESYLNVDIDGLENAIRKCWNSVEANHVKEYAKDKDLDEDSLLVGVAIQEMIDSEVAGVMFTVNPVTGNSNQIMIESAYGLGETVVQGVVTPDNYLIDKKIMTVTNYGIQIKEKMMIFKDGKNVISNVPEGLSDRATLREEQVTELATLGTRIEKLYGFPQDIEWAFYKNDFYIVQSRPITTFVE